MRSCNETKEDIRLRMAELEKKLAESEEERQKLEKTCNVLMRAFREEEKMHYKALNKKYEKFLEDCSMRKGRNEIILKSLCRIEDRSKALFAKTERLKLLKDRYVSYLKINEIKLDQFSQLCKNYPLSEKKLATSVCWKTPLALNLNPFEEYKKEERIVFTSKEMPNVFANKLICRSFDDEKHGRERSDLFQEPEVGGKNESDKVIITSYNEIIKNPDRPIAIEIKNEELAKNITEHTRKVVTAKNENLENDLKHVASRTEVEGYKESIEKIREALAMVEDQEARNRDPVTRRFPETANITLEATENKSSKQSKSLDQYQNIDDFGATSALVTRDEDSDPLEPMASEEDSPRENALPQGLDGVDYQNETYPESYYEQPVHHHNHTSIASDVILEEDETEQDVEQSAVVGDAAEGSDRVRRQESDSESEERWKRSEVGKSSDSGKAVVEKNRFSGRSNLLQMLESDSESFQIEHGDEISGQEDSDFDFSFGKN